MLQLWKLGRGDQYAKFSCITRKHIVSTNGAMQSVPRKNRRRVGYLYLKGIGEGFEVVGLDPGD